MTKTPIDIHAEITSRIVAAIEDGIAGDFRLPWNNSGSGGLPTNIASKRQYQGINILALWVAALHQGYSRPVWGTYRQWQEQGCQVRKGEKASLVVFYKTFTVECEAEDAATTESRERSFARASWVFNADQVEGYEAKPVEAPCPLFTPIEKAEQFAAAVGARIVEGGSMACYSPREDLIRMPERSRFYGTESMDAAESYYATLMHELTHWSAAPTRCERDLKHRFGSEAYAMEELIAELGAAFLCAELAITPELRPDHASYVANWLAVLKHDKKAIFTAASKAQQAVSFLNGLAAQQS